MASLPDLPRHGGELILLRHGESTANALGIGQGRADYPLSDKGREQARLTAQFLKDLAPFAALYASPLSRAWETASLLGDTLDLAPVAWDQLVEIDIGELSGRSMAQLKALYPEAVQAFEEAEAQRPHPTNRELLPGWEPIHAIIDRVWHGLHAIAHRHPGGRILVVAHGGVINGFLTHLLLGDARQTPWQFAQKNCAISRIHLGQDGPQVRCHSFNDHLSEWATGTTVFDPASSAPPP